MLEQDQKGLTEKPEVREEGVVSTNCFENVVNACNKSFLLILVYLKDIEFKLAVLSVLIL